MTEPVVTWAYAGPQPTFTAVVNLPSQAPAPSPAPEPSAPTMPLTLPGTWSHAAGDTFDSGTLDSNLYGLGMWFGDSNDNHSAPITTHTVANGQLNLYPTMGVNGLLVSRHITTEGKWTCPTDKRFYLEVRAKLARGAGRWPAIWLFNHLDNGNPSRPEIDLMESGSGTDYGTIQGGPYAGTMNAWTDTGQGAPLTWPGGGSVNHTNHGAYIRFESQTLTTEFHRWGVDCDPATGVIDFYFDRVKIGTISDMASMLATPKYLIFSEEYRTGSSETGPYNIGAPGDVQTLLTEHLPYAIDSWHCWTQAAAVVPAPTPAPAPSPSPAPAPSPAASNPVTTALTGMRTFNVTTDAELDAVPFATLTAGDVVNIFHRSTPYKRLIRVRTSGTQQAPIVINGVTNSSGDRPVFSGNGATVAAGCMPGCFSSTNSASWQYREAIGLIATAIGPADDYNARPQHVQFKNLEVTDVRAGLPFTDAMGANHTWDQASAIRIQDGADTLVENCVIHGNDFGYFTQANNDDALHAPLRPVLRTSRLYNNGMPNRSTEHNIYLQGIDPVVEGCYIGLTCTGSLGSSFKSRSANLVFRYNWVEASERALDIVHSEDSWNGVQAAANYGVSHVYGNVICNDWMRLSRGATYPFHVGGDNMGEDGPTGAALVTDTSLTAGGNKRVYQHTVYAYDNTFVFRSNSNQTYRMSWFDLSLSGTATQPRTTAYEWNNAVLMEGSSEWAQLRYAGQIVHGGGSRAQVQGTLRLSHENADSAKFNISGSLATGALGLTDQTTGDVRPAAGSALIGSRVGTPAGLPSTFRPELVAVGQPVILGNGIIARATPTAVGALEPA